MVSGKKQVAEEQIPYDCIHVFKNVYRYLYMLAWTFKNSVLTFQKWNHAMRVEWFFILKIKPCSRGTVQYSHAIFPWRTQWALTSQQHPKHTGKDYGHFANHVSDKGFLSGAYKVLSQPSHNKMNNSTLKSVKDPNRYFSNDYKWSLGIEKMLNIINRQGNANQTYKRHHFIHTRKTIIKKTDDDKC